MSPFPIPSLSSPPSSCPKPIFPKPPHQNLSLTSGSRSPPLLQPHTDPMDMSLGTNPDNICNLNNQEDNNFVEREHMFDKVVTPSDVGKLNRLVIPKQHAERYFPLDSSSDEKGLLLNFEDRNGKSWRFRYSYWTSSQSYVMTKGWSRFVKENKLDAGDIVSFQRGVGELGRGRLFIDSGRRLPSSGRSFQIPNPYLAFLSPPPSSPSRWGRLYDSLPQTMPYFRPLQSHPLINYSVSHHQELIRATGTYHGDVYLRSGAEEEAQPEAIDSLAANQAAAKTLRLFGVNMEYASGADCGPSSSSNSTCQGRAESRRKGEGSTSFDLDL